ncbi:MAG: hypothetical protein Q4P05_00880, partial [Actinomycetaceae bacterium]|nr:hypothetical protein [Actinomycetaceae bacterium]
TYSAQPNTDDNQPRVRTGGPVPPPDPDPEDDLQFDLSVSWSEADACHLIVTATASADNPDTPALLDTRIQALGVTMASENDRSFPAGQTVTMRLPIRLASPEDGYYVHSEAWLSSGNEGEDPLLGTKKLWWKPDNIDDFNQTLKDKGCVSSVKLEVSYTPGSCQLTTRVSGLPAPGYDNGTAKTEYYSTSLIIGRIHHPSKFKIEGNETSATVQHSLIGKKLMVEQVRVSLRDNLKVLAVQPFEQDGFLTDVNTNCSKPKIEFSSDDTCTIKMKITNVLQTGEYKLLDNSSGVSHKLNLSAGDEPTIDHPIMTTMRRDTKGDYFSFTLWYDNQRVGDYEYREFGHDNEWISANCVPPVTVTRDGCELKVEGSKFFAGDYRVDASTGDSDSVTGTYMITVGNDGKLSGSLPFTAVPEGDAVRMHVSRWTASTALTTVTLEEPGLTDTVANTCMPSVTVTRDGCVLNATVKNVSPGDYYVVAQDSSTDPEQELSFKEKVTITSLDKEKTVSLRFKRALTDDSMNVVVKRSSSSEATVENTYSETGLATDVNSTCVPAVALTRDGCVLNVTASGLDRLAPKRMKYFLEADGGADMPTTAVVNYPSDTTDGSYTLQHRITAEFAPENPGVDIKLSMVEDSGIAELVRDMTYEDVPESVIKACAASNGASAEPQPDPVPGDGSGEGSGTDSEPSDSGKTDTAGKTGDSGSGGAASTLARTGVDTHRLTVLITLASIMLMVGAASTSISRKKN